MTIGEAVAACVAVLRTLYAGRVQHATGDACYTQEDDGSTTSNGGCAYPIAFRSRRLAAPPYGKLWDVAKTGLLVEAMIWDESTRPELAGSC